ncbi:MAG: DUF2812 domain-containing protein [Firmicutes bacterium]|nr:DUF2812 domain-containing protein [Bacillota bacterium]
MRNTKYRLESFQLYDFSGMEDHLAKMARKGWALEKVGALFWKYRRIEPQELEFSVTYYPEASVYDPGPTESQRRLYDICEEMGWNFVGEWWQMQIFSRPIAATAGGGCQAEEVSRTPLETDPQVKLANIQRTMKRSGGSGNLVSLLMIPLFLMMMFLRKSMMDRLTDAYTLFALAEYVVLAAYALTNLAFYGVWYRKAKLAADRGEELPPVNGAYRTLGRIYIVISIASMFLWGRYFGKAMYYIVGGLVLVACLISTFAGEQLRLGMKKRGVARETNRKVTMISIGVMSLITTTLMTAVLIFGVTHHWFREGSQPTEYTTYAKNGSSWTWDVYHDELPLEVEDFMETEYEHYSKERRENNESILAHYAAFRQNGFPDGEDPAELEYEILDTKLWYDTCVQDMIEEETRFREDDVFRTDGMDPLGKRLNAKTVYQLHRSDGPRPIYLICWTEDHGGRNRIVRIEFSWEPTEDQLALAGERLLNAEL